MQVESFLKEKIKKYYSDNFVTHPIQVSFREFGYGAFGKKISQRHVAFKDDKDFNNFLREVNPFYVSYSGAYYKFPARRPMQKKEMLKSDLFYEFDADDFESSCRQKHDSWKCSCGAKGKGVVKNCDACGKIPETDEWVCNECLGKTKKGIFELLKIMENEWGINTGLSVSFSGHKGYHLVLRNELLLNLSKDARTELADYFTATGFSFEKNGFIVEKNQMACPKQGDLFGLSKRIMQKVESVFENVDPNNLESIQVFANELNFTGRMKVPTRIAEQKEKYLLSLRKGILPDLVKVKKDNIEKWNAFLNHIKDSLVLPIDRQVSIDQYRLLRVPNTIHGGSGMLAKVIPIDELKEFKPLSEAIIFKDSMLKIFVTNTPKFELNSEEFGPYENEWVNIPEYAAIYLLSRKRGSFEEKI